jgi:phosphatidylglycerol---prolipoprotein diacylglyceryl transferase
MIPYFTLPDLRIPLPFTLLGSDGITLHGFGLLVAVAVIVGHWQMMSYAARHSVPVDTLARMVGPMLITGFIGAHLFVVTLYRPEEFAANWWKVWDGLSSFGGFLGALVAMLVYRVALRIQLLPYADAILYGLAHGWIFGRAGCASVHDHPGRLTTFPLSVLFPPEHRYAGQRFDLGLIEMLYTIVIVLILRYIVEPRLKRRGEMTAWVGLLYAPVRFFLDFLRATDIEGADIRYAGLTPAQYACIASIIACIGILAWLRRVPADATIDRPLTPASITNSGRKA